MPRVYISYRPEDSSRNEVAIIRQRLMDVFGAQNVLESTGNTDETTMDLQRLVHSCDVLLVVIGRWWAQMVDEAGTYLLNNPYDPIHVELYAGLKKRMMMNILMVDGAPIPEAAQLPDVLHGLLKQDITEAPDDNELNNFLDAFIEQVSAIPDQTPAQQDIESTPLVSGRSVEVKDREQLRRELALGEQVRRQSAQASRVSTVTTSEQTQTNNAAKYVGWGIIMLAVIVFSVVGTSLSSISHPPRHTSTADSSAVRQPTESEYPASIAEMTHAAQQIATTEAKATHTTQEVASTEANVTLNTPTTTHLRLSPFTFDILSNQLAFSPDSRYLFAHSNVFQRTTIFDIQAQSPIHTILPQGSYYGVQFVSNTKIAFFHYDERETHVLTVWDVESDQPVVDAYPVDRFHIDYSRIFASDSGTEAILITSDNQLMRWWVSSEGSTIVKQVEFENDDSLQYELDVDVANHVFTISDQEQVRVYDLTTLDLIAALAQPDPSIFYHAFMPDRDALLLINVQGNVSAWDYRDDTFKDFGQIDIVDKTRPYVRTRIAYDPANQYVFTSYLTQYERIDVWDIHTMKRLLHYGPPENYDVISDLRVSPDGRYLASMNDTVLYTLEES